MSDAATPNPYEKPTTESGQDQTNALAERQCWAAESNGDYYLTVLDSGTLYLLEGVKRKVSRAAVESLQAGAETIDALGTKSIAIPAERVNRMEVSEHAELIKLWHDVGGREKKQTVLMESHDERMAVVEGIAASMGGAIERTDQPLPLAQAIIGPGLTLLGMIASTIVCYLAAADIDPNEEYNPTGRRRGMKKLARTLMLTLGPNGVLVVGALCIAGAAFWLYRRISNPPTQTILARAA